MYTGVFAVTANLLVAAATNWYKKNGTRLLAIEKASMYYYTILEIQVWSAKAASSIYIEGTKTKFIF